MRNFNKKPTVFIAALTSLLIAGPVLASTFTGRVEAFRFSPGATPARVSVYVAAPTDCSGGQFYSYENADSGLGQLWTNALSQALLHARQVFIQGNGICDSFGFEGVIFIDFR